MRAPAGRRCVTGIAAPLATAAVLVTAGLAPAHADPARCRQTILREAVRLAATRLRALQRCEELVLQGKATGPCPDERATRTVARAEARLGRLLARHCGGRNRRCDAADTGADADEAPAAVGWPATCPGYGAAACGGAIADCDDVGACLACTTAAAVDQLVALAHPAPLVPSPERVLARCRAAIGREAFRLFQRRAQAHAACEEGVLRGTVAGPCPDARAAAALADADARWAAALGRLGQRCDLGPETLAFDATCPPVRTEGGRVCSGAIHDVDDLSTCLVCMTEFAGECLDGLSVAGAKPYPAGCVPPVGPCPGRIEFEADPATGGLDLGWSGIAHDLPTATTDNKVTAEVTGCALPGPPCGTCTFTGPVPNAAPGAGDLDNQRCAKDTSISCAADADCAAVGGACVFYLNSYLPAAAGGVQACVLQGVRSMSGTADFASGESTLDITVDAGISLVECPSCVGDATRNDGVHGGSCSAGPRAGLPCDANGAVHPLLPDTSFDCPPPPPPVPLALHLELTTGTTTRTLTEASPNCSAPTFEGFKCHCDTCDDAVGTPCASDADCAAVGATTCGGKRCLSGPMLGKPCATPSDCAFNPCAVLGRATLPNICSDRVCSPAGGGEGQCLAGPFTGSCTPTATFQGCFFDATCAGFTSCAGGTNDGGICTSAADCPDGACVPDTCLFHSYECFTDDGMVGGTVSAFGSATTPVADEWDAVLAGLTCAPPVASSSVNDVAGLPGLTRLNLGLHLRGLP